MNTQKFIDENVHDLLKMAYEHDESKPLQMDLYAPGMS